MPRAAPSASPTTVSWTTWGWWSGRPGIAPTTPGSRSPAWSVRAMSCTGAASPRSPACTSWDCPGSTPAGRPCWASSTTTRPTWPSGLLRGTRKMNRRPQVAAPRTTGMPERRPAARLARGLRRSGLSGATVAGAAAAGVLTSMRTAYPRPPNLVPAEGRPAAKVVPDDRLAVAVVLGASGSVITDALGPYEVFARSPRFLVYTVSASQPTAMLSGGLAVMPDYSIADVDAGTAPAPDVIVVPAVVAPTGRKEAPLRQWIAAQADRGAHILGVCNGARLLAATGLLDGRRATAHWSALRSLQRRHPKVSWERGQRYVQHEEVTTTAGVTSGVFGALR